MRTPFETTPLDEKDYMDASFLKIREEVIKTFGEVFFDVSGDNAEMFRAGFFAGWMEAGGKDPRGKLKP